MHHKAVIVICLEGIGSAIWEEWVGVWHILRGKRKWKARGTIPIGDFLKQCLERFAGRHPCQWRIRSNPREHRVNLSELQRNILNNYFENHQTNLSSNSPDIARHCQTSPVCTNCPVCRFSKFVLTSPTFVCDPGRTCGDRGASSALLVWSFCFCFVSQGIHGCVQSWLFL
jgi:hypothetical protein